MHVPVEHDVPTPTASVSELQAEVERLTATRDRLQAEVAQLRDTLEGLRAGAPAATRSSAFDEDDDGAMAAFEAFFTAEVEHDKSRAWFLADAHAGS